MSARKDDRSWFKKEASPDDADRTFPNRHQPNIIQGLNRKNNSRHRQLKSPDCYFSADIAQFFLQTLADNISLGQREFFCLVLPKRFYNVGRLGFFVRAVPRLCFGRHWHVLIYSARKRLAHLGKKMWFTGTDRKQCKPTSARKDDRSRFGKEAPPDGADCTFPNGHHPNITQGLNRKHNSRHRPL